jgi:tetratricopeptide (TPR) repeat protein
VTSPERVRALQNAIRLYAEFGPTDEVYAAALSSLGGIRHRTGDNIEAIALYQRAIQVIQTRFGGGYGELAPLCDNLAQARASTGDFDAAAVRESRRHTACLRTHARSLRVCHRHLRAVAAPSRSTRTCDCEIGTPDCRRGTGIGQILERVRGAGGHVGARSCGGCLLEEGRARQAIPYLEAAIRIYAALPMYSDENGSHSLAPDLAEAYLAAGRARGTNASSHP